jgi:uncharacterized alpha-E superfamily protein
MGTARASRPGKPVTAAKVMAYMALDPDNPASIHACL